MCEIEHTRLLFRARGKKMFLSDVKTQVFFSKNFFSKSRYKLVLVKCLLCLCEIHLIVYTSSR